MPAHSPPHETFGRRRFEPQAERALVLAARDHGSEREQLVEAFMPLISGVARLYRGSPAVERGELLQEGVVGLLRALERFDPDLGTPFWAYASWWVRQAMQQLVAEVTRPVVLSDRAARGLARVKDTQRRFVQEQGREPSTGELASESGLSIAQVQCLQAAERRPRGLEEPIGGEAATGETFGERLPDPRAEDAYETVGRRVQAEHLPAMLAELGEREHLVVAARFGLRGPARTLSEVARELGVSAERVRQIEQRALDKLRAAATA
jgi:RNA polymerase sigma factor (sigma-70 family)